MAVAFRNSWLEAFYVEDLSHKKIPSAIEGAIFRKPQILDAATSVSDLRVPPGNRFEHLQGNLSGWCSIRINKQYRLIFRWDEGTALDTYLDPHAYKG
ncbi:type II toxin-antitoxin system RelE/ParE family toxin [Marinobacterium lutimaris]|uniref:Proteic killer suppression protein n=1 Tax=Marinobacterium lutimaris TaxID=568106 RepID=A0A1H6DXC3_9GAMM|nr:type II toxin-antitoxin system RelE/ParE family toxin [Marinobacterium lutimaris]SEG89366.1 proteic killer suppression protein [Marinobacterium lutimaris]